MRKFYVITTTSMYEVVIDRDSVKAVKVALAEGAKSELPCGIEAVCSWRNFLAIYDYLSAPGWVSSRRWFRSRRAGWACGGRGLLWDGQSHGPQERHQLRQSARQGDPDVDPHAGR